MNKVKNRNIQTIVPKGTVVRFLPTMNESDPGRHLYGKILYYPKSSGYENKIPNIGSKVLTVMVEDISTGNVLRVDARGIDKHSIKALQTKINGGRTK